MLLTGYLGSLRAMAVAGHQVLGESVILPVNLDLYRRSLEGLDVFIVGVRCPIDVAEARERARAPTERNLGVPIDLRVPEFDLVHGGPYDVEFDTSVTPVDDAVRSIVGTLSRPPSAFNNWTRTG